MLVEAVEQAWCVGLGGIKANTWSLLLSPGRRILDPCNGILRDAHILFREKFPVIVLRPFGALGSGILRMCLRLEQGCCPISRVPPVLQEWPEEVCASEE